MQHAIVIDDHQPIPKFDAAFRESSPYFYFHHIIDPVAATLRVEVIGPNLTYTFRHERAKELLSVSEIANRLERKTVGFIALVAEGGKRISLSWAESGHGAGRDGDLLDADPSVLPNDVWTKRVIAVGKILGLNMRRPFDGSVSIAMGRDLSGVFLGGHVEVKLAVHAIFVLLKIFDITQDADSLSHRHLRKLREVRWQDGTRPAFEIYFSRKNCGFCGSLVKKLEMLTGVPLRLVWKERLVKVVYAKITLDKTRKPARPRPQQQRQQQEEDEDDIEDDETVIADDVQLVDYVDLTGDSSHPLRNPGDNAPPLAADIINLIDDEEEVNDDDDNNAANSPSRSPTPPSSPRQQQQHRIAADAYIDGLAYCVGQIDQCPQGAQAAIIELAKTLSRQRNSSTRRAPAPRNHHAWSSISKPLPATPETQPPGWMAAQPAAAPAGAPQTGGQAVEVPVVEAQLPTPPASQSKQESQKQQQRSGFSQRDRSKSPSEQHQRRRQADVQIRQRSPRRHYSLRGGEKKEVDDDDDINTGRFRRVSICVEIPARRYSSSSPDPF